MRWKVYCARLTESFYSKKKRRRGAAQYNRTCLVSASGLYYLWNVNLNYRQRMEKELLLEKLNRRQINPTAMRLLILDAMMQFQRAFSLSDLENYLDTADKSTIFRTITLFLAHHLIHCIDDGSGSLKYAVCSNSCNCSVDDLHTHFFCIKCQRTFCLKTIHIPLVKLPEQFTLQSVNYVLKGLCPDCSVKESEG